MPERRQRNWIIVLSLLLVVSMVANGYLWVQLLLGEATAKALLRHIGNLELENENKQQTIERTAKLGMTPKEMIAWLNGEVATEVIEDAHFTYRLEDAKESKGEIVANWTMIGQGSLNARRLVGDGMAAYYRRVNALLEPKGLAIQQSYYSDTPRWDQATNTITWQEPLCFGPRRR